MKTVEDLNVRGFCAQGTVGVGARIPTFTVPFPQAEYRQTTVGGSLLGILSFYP